MSVILAIETSTSACSVAISRDGQVDEVFEVLPQKHAQRVLEMVDELLVKQQLNPQQIDYLAFGEGPGAFTGVRIAAGVVQGLAIGWNKPVIPVCSLQAMALTGLMDSNCENSTWIALMDARMQEIYLASGQGDSKDLSTWQASDARLLNEEGCLAVLQDCADKNCVVLGDIDQVYPQLSAVKNPYISCQPSAASVARLAGINLDKAQGIDEAVPMPKYLRNHVADTIEERQAKQKSKQKVS